MTRLVATPKVKKIALNATKSSGKGSTLQMILAMKQRSPYLIALAIPVLLSASVRAQTQPASTPAAAPFFQHWSLSLLAGPSLPTGTFASKDNSSSEPGHARIGAGAELDLTYWLNRSFGVMFAAGGQEISVAPFTPYLTARTEGSTIKNDPWKVGRFLAGGTFRRPLSARFTVDIRVLGGLLKTSIPGYTYYPPFEFAPHPGPTRWAAFSLPWTFAYEAGAGLQWQLPGRLFLRMDAGFIGADPNNNKAILIYNPPAGVTTIGIAPPPPKQPITVLQLGVGAGIHF